jgi:hypothetical protein
MTRVPTVPALVAAALVFALSMPGSAFSQGFYGKRGPQAFSGIRGEVGDTFAPAKGEFGDYYGDQLRYYHSEEYYEKKYWKDPTTPAARRFGNLAPPNLAPPPKPGRVNDLFGNDQLVFETRRIEESQRRAYAGALPGGVCPGSVLLQQLRDGARDIHVMFAKLRECMGGNGSGGRQ